MNKLSLFISLVILTVTTNLSAQNSVTISPRTLKINAGETAILSVAVTVHSGFDASVFLTSTAAISPTIINYPYTQLSTLTFKTANYTKRGFYTTYVTAKMGNVTVKDSCIVEVINPAPWKIFNSIQGEERPAFITLDEDGKIYYSLLRIGGDELFNFDRDGYGAVFATHITNPLINNEFLKYSYKPNIRAETYNMVTGNDTTKYFFTQRGLYKVNYGNLTIYNTSNSGLPSNDVKRGVIDADGRVWLGTASGLASLENYIITRYDSSTTNSTLGNEKITALTLGEDGRLWIGTPNGLVVKEGNTWTRYTPQNSGLPAPYIFGLAVDKNGAMWMGSSKMVKYRSSTYEIFNDCPDNMVGLVKFNGASWTLYDSTNSPLRSNFVNGLIVDKNGNLWLGTAPYKADFAIGGSLKAFKGCGLLKYDGANWTTFDMSNSPLPDNDVQWVGTDRTGNIWFSCKSMFGVMNEEGIPFLVNDVEENPETKSDKFTITPNPTSTSFTIRSLENISSVMIVNSMGMEVKQWLLVNDQLSFDVDVSDLSSGVYFVQMRTPTGMITKSIIVSH